ncbi:MAG: ethanolamine ammonia-lyase reactivating factor EutA [Pirellulaceae bacterium]|jgi:ethanolamine utilization protein EutA|nr:ethanolamine ammonia-lyase reactivating factor EutA [Pirellulaceae bacterium]
MTADVKLVGLDFGTTTSSAVIASAQLARNAVTAKTELTGVREVYRSAMVFTPTLDDGLDERALARLVDEWMLCGEIDPRDVFGGGALLTGLAAQRANAAAVVRTIRNHLKNALIATADDPSLESWLAFMGGCASLSRAHPDLPIVNLDIGGGTTNLALGLAGNVLRTGCLYVGARHIEVIPGGYRIRRLSPQAEQLLTELRIAKGVGDCLTEAEVNAVLDFYIDLLSTALEGESDKNESRAAQLHDVTALRIPPNLDNRENIVVTVSGGVGALIYSRLSGQAWPSTTRYGDLGIDLARRLLDSPWAESLRSYASQSAGRATVYGLLRHNTEVSGRTLFLPHPECLPLTDVPIFGVIASDSTDEDIENLTSLMQRAGGGACVQLKLTIDDGPPTGPAIRALAERLSRTLQARDFPPDQPLVLLVAENVGKVLGNYLTEWGGLPLNLIVVDEVDAPRAQYVRIGRLREQVVPVSFYGLQD